MKLSVPKQIVWWIATILGVLGILGRILTISFITVNSWWLLLIAFVLLFLGTVLKSL
ncbi:MAG: hypothetical protein R6V04_06150 [bacterium]